MLSCPVLVSLRRITWLREVLTGWLLATLLLLPAHGQSGSPPASPAWWTQRQVIDPGKTSDDFAAINQGQLKYLVASAVAEMNAKLSGGAGASLNGLVSAWTANTTGADDFAAVNIGQLKAIAKPVYERLLAAQVITTLPAWTTPSGSGDFAVANIGQAKNLFAFPIPNQLNGGLELPIGWQGSKWTENPEEIPPLEISQEAFPVAVLKDHYLDEYVVPAETTLLTTLQWRRADLWGVSGVDRANVARSLYQLTNGRQEGVNNGYALDASPGTWWYYLPPGVLSASQLNNTWSAFSAVPLSNPPSPISTHPLHDCVALKLRESPYQYAPSLDSGVVITGALREDRWTEVRLKLDHASYLADRQIIKEYWRSDEYEARGPKARRYRFVINPGTSKSSQEINFVASDIGRVFLYEAPPIKGRNISPADVAGPRYRKIGLNGVPQSDSPPQNQEESDIPADETYVDAYSRTLRHSVTDIWSKVGSTELPLAVRRTSAPEVWSWNGSLRPEERPDRPFGAGFTSNLTPQISFQQTASVPLQHRQPIRATVVDENGSSRSFVQVNVGNADLWVPDLDQKQDAKTCFDKLVRIPGTSPVVWELRKKFGTTCRYEMMFADDSRIGRGSFGGGVIHTFPADRELGSRTFTSYQYGRMRNVTDRQGNEMRYSYPDDQMPGSVLQSFIPDKIYDPERPSQAIYIAQQNGRVQAIRGPSGEVVRYYYTIISVNEGGNPYNLPVLERVVRGEGASAVEVKYTHAYSLETELDVDPTSPQATRYGHMEIEAIIDERNFAHQFAYADFLDAAQTSYDYSNGYYTFSKRQSGGPRMLSSISRPNGQVVTFGGNRSMHYHISGSVSLDPSGLTTTVTSASTGTYTYAFKSPHIFCPVPLTEDNPQNVIASFREMTITSPAGTESYEFDPEAGMALKHAKDISGNVTSYTYDSAIASPSAALVNYGLLKFDDPTTETNAMHTKNFNGIKRYEYEPNFRLLKKVTDEKGTVTEYTIDGIGRRTQEKITDVSGKVLRVTDFKYEHGTYAGFMTGQIVKVTGLGAVPSGIPTPVGEMRTDFVPDTDGRIKQQKVYAGVNASMPLITSFTYTGNGSKRTVTDPRNKTTTFEYEPHTLRLKKVIYPDANFKENYYDEHGNLVRQVNETGANTLHEYDLLNRRIKTTVDMNGNVLPDGRYTTVFPGSELNAPTYDGDIVTEITYNDFNLPVDETDSRGIMTHNEYDTAGRRVKTTVNYDGNSDSVSAMELVTEYVDDNPATPDWVGGSMFDTSSFKPLRVKDPRGFVSDFTYDKRYRVTQVKLKDTSYSPAQEIVTQTEYDTVGNAVAITDPLGNVTRTDYDGLNRAVRTVLPSKAGGADSNVPHAQKTMAYTPAGQVWSSTDELGNTTFNVYDHAGRLSTTLMPEVEVLGAGSMLFRPQVWQSYDEAGNVMERSDALGNITLTEHDSRNRPVKVTLPAVLDAQTGLLDTPETTTLYDEMGRVVVVTDPLGRSTTTAYDNASRAYVVIAPPIGSQTHITVSSHDPAGQILTVTNAENQTTINRYDALGRLEATTDAEEILNQFGYDKAGNRIRVLDGLAQETLFAYDAQNRLIEEEFDNGDTRTYVYDAVNKVSQKDAKLVQTTYTYDVRNRLRKVTAPDLERLYAYDDAGRLLNVTETGRPEASVSYAYDALARITAETSQGVTHTYGYDLAGNRVKTAYGTGRTVFTIYDTLNRPSTITESGHTTTYGYDLAGRALKLQAGNGQVTKNVYDELGRLTKRTLFASTADLTPTGVLAEFGWGHDAIGNVTAHAEQWKANASRPVGARTTAMTYDGANRLRTETVNDPASGITVTTYTYDDAHNRESKTVINGSDPGYWHYDYNEVNQLSSWTQHDEPNGTLLKSAGLAYDANGNRVGLEVAGQSGTSANASLMDQGITYMAVASGVAGDGVSVSLNGEQADQALGVSVVGGDHVVVNLETGPASVDTWVNQGITYTTDAVHQPGEDVSISLLADEPDQAQAVEVVGKDIKVKLATGSGAAAAGSSQDIAYQAATAGPGGNDLKIHLEKAPLGEPASATRTGKDITVKLETDAGTPDSLVNQGITYTTVTPHEAGKEISITLVAEEPNQIPEVQVMDNDIRVLLETDNGGPAQADHLNIHYEAVTPGVAGNDMTVRYELAGQGENLTVVPPVSGGHETVVKLKHHGEKPFVALQGITYETADYGYINHDHPVTVTHVVNGPGQPLDISQYGNDMTISLATSLGDKAEAELYDGKILLTAVDPGPAGNEISVNITLSDMPDQFMEVSVEGKTINIRLASDSNGDPHTFFFDYIGGEIQRLAGHLVQVSYGLDANNLGSSGTSASLTGGGENYVILTRGYEIALNAANSTVVRVKDYDESGSTYLKAESGDLSGGANPDIMTTSKNVVEAVNDTPAVSSLLLLTGGVDSLMMPSVVQLSGGGSNPTAETTVSQLTALINGNQTLITATGFGTGKILPLQRRTLGAGWEPDVITKTSAVVGLLATAGDISDFITVTGGSPEEVARVGSVQLTGGGLGFGIESTVTGVVTALNSHGVAGGLITATGSGTSTLAALPRTALRGGAPAILSDADDVVALLAGHSIVTATGSGSAALYPMGRTYLSSTISKTAYAWNSQDRLTGVKMPDGTLHGYTYDYRARRVQTSRRHGPLPELATAIVFAGGLSLAEYESSAPGVIPPHAPTVHYLRGPDMGGGVGGMLYSIRGSSLKYSLNNGRGDIVAQSDENATLTWTASYEAYGKRPVETGSNADKQRANSKDEDPTGLLNEGFRYRDLETGVWLSRDPAGFVDGPNLYAYVKQNPWSSFDPEGLEQATLEKPAVKLTPGPFLNSPKPPIAPAGGAALAGLTRLSPLAILFCPGSTPVRQPPPGAAPVPRGEGTNPIEGFYEYGKAIVEEIQNPTPKPAPAPAPTGTAIQNKDQNDILVNRIGGGGVSNLQLKPGEEKETPPGISVLLGVPPQVAAEQMRTTFPKATRLQEESKTTGASTANRIRATGFTVVPTPTKNLPNHGTLTHPAGAAGFTPENLSRLSGAFIDVPTPPIIRP